MQHTQQPMVANLKLSITLLIMFFGLFINTASASIQAKVDREYAYEGETITLTISVDNRTNLQDPDFSPLQKDFDIGGTSESTSISIFNGKRSDKHTWSVRLMPLKSGSLEIPSIQVGNESTLPLKIDVRPIPVQSGSHQGEALFLTMKIDSEAKHFYVQQQIPVVIRLYYKFDLSQGQITDPAPENGQLERIGEDNTYSTTYNGEQYQVFERRYSLFAEKSGELVLPSVSFRGYLKKQNNNGQRKRHDFFSQFGSPFSNSTGQPVSIRSKSLNLQIEPHPAAFSGQQWLPAESIELKDSWTDAPPTFRVGEPVTRTISLQAKGLVASQIKPLDLPTLTAFRRYAEPAETSTKTDGHHVYANSRQNYTYIPSAGGEQVIPAIELSWWNVLTDTQETATLPAWKVFVEADPNQANQPSDSTIVNNATQPPAQASHPAPAPIKSQEQPTKPQAITDQQDVGERALNWLRSFEKDTLLVVSLCSISLLLLVIIFLLFRKKAPVQVSTAKVESADYRAARRTENLSELRAALTQACKLNDSAHACQILLKTGQQLWPNNPPSSIGEIANRLPEASDAIRDLDRHLFAGNSQDWQGKLLLEKLNVIFTADKRKQEQQEILKPLYPS